MPVRYIDEEETEKSDIDPSYITTEDMPEVVECTFAADSVLAVRHELPLDPPDTGLRVPIPSYDNNRQCGEYGGELRIGGAHILECHWCGLWYGHRAICRPSHGHRIDVGTLWGTVPSAPA